MDEKQIEELFDRYKNGTATEEELKLIDTWYGNLNRSKNKNYTEKKLAKDEKEVWEKMPFNAPKRTRRLWPWIPKVAAIVSLLSISLYYTIKHSKTQNQIVSNIAPASNKAILTLGDGKKIVLNNAKNGLLTTESGINISKVADGQLAYTLSGQNKIGIFSATNIITVPNGGHYQLILPDGSKITLNAASSLSFPSSFAGLKERKVLLIGEAYFEIAKDKNKPFKVQTGNQLVEVLGTHFNISGYADENEIQTTLLEGKVKLSSKANANEALLKPGEKSYYGNSGNFKISLVADTNEAIAWKNGDFSFHEDLKTAMKSIARWYDVEVIYETGVPENLILQGWVSRKSNLGDVLTMIENLGGIHFKVNERRITVMK